MPSANYDNAAWFYDRLSRIVYGKALVNAQAYLLPHIPPRANVLIVGGGTGRILEELARVHPEPLQITYVEISEKMMARSRQRYVGNHRVSYILNDVQDADLDTSYDVIITAFLFDNFKGDTLQRVFNTLHERLKPSGLWLNTDFELTGKWWQSLMLKSMLLFFRILCHIEASTLPDIAGLFKNYRVIDSKSFFGQFIRSAAYLKK